MSSSERPYILFITGASTAGKTSLHESLAADPDFETVVFHDVDENGVPNTGRKPWRHFRVEELFELAAKRLVAGESTIVCGISFPHEIIDSETYSTGMNLHFLTVTITREQIRQRLTERIAGNGDIERFGEDFQETRILEAFEMQRLLQHQTENQRNGHSIDASTLSLSGLHEQAKQIIQHMSMGD